MKIRRENPSNPRPVIPTPVRSEGGLLLIKPPSVSLSVRRTVKSRDLLSLSRVKGGEKLKRERLVAAYTKKGGQRGAERGQEPGDYWLLSLLYKLRQTIATPLSLLHKVKRRGEEKTTEIISSILSCPVFKVRKKIREIRVRASLVLSLCALRAVSADKLEGDNVF